MCGVCAKTCSSVTEGVTESLPGGTKVRVCRDCVTANLRPENGGGSGSGGGEQPLNMSLKTRKRTRSEDREEAVGGRGEDVAKKDNPTKLRRNGEEPKKYRLVKIVN